MAKTRRVRWFKIKLCSFWAVIMLFATASSVRKVEKKWRRVAELDPRPNGDEASLPSCHSCLCGDRKPIPPCPLGVVSWSPTAACWRSPRPFASSSRGGSSPTNRRSRQEEVLHYRARKWSLRYFLLRNKEDGTDSPHSVWKKKKKEVDGLVLVEALCGVIWDLKPSQAVSHHAAA